MKLPNTPAGRFVLGVLGVIALLAIILGLWLGSYWIRGETAPFRGSVDAQETIQSGQFRIAAYDHFFNLCAAVQSDEQRILALQEELEGGVSESREEQIKASMTAIRSSRASKINQYNADARREYTQGQFRDNSLPWELSHDSEDTSCHA